MNIYLKCFDQYFVKLLIIIHIISIFSAIIVFSLSFSLSLNNVHLAEILYLVIILNLFAEIIFIVSFFSNDILSIIVFAFIKFPFPTTPYLFLELKSYLANKEITKFLRYIFKHNSLEIVTFRRENE